MDRRRCGSGTSGWDEVGILGNEPGKVNAAQERSRLLEVTGLAGALTGLLASLPSGASGDIYYSGDIYICDGSLDMDNGGIDDFVIHYGSNTWGDYWFTLTGEPNRQAFVRANTAHEVAWYDAGHNCKTPTDTTKWLVNPWRVPGNEGFVKVTFMCDRSVDTQCYGWLKYNAQACVTEFAGTTVATDAIVTGQTEPTYVSLVSFNGTCQDGKGNITWETATEIDSAGFNVYRGQNPSGPFSLVNENLIPATGGPVSGSSYEMTDDRVNEGDTYWYRLEEIASDGTSTFFDPIEVVCPEAPNPEPITAWTPASSVENVKVEPGSALNIFSFFLPPVTAIALWLRSRRKKNGAARGQS